MKTSIGEKLYDFHGFKKAAIVLTSNIHITQQRIACAEHGIANVNTVFRLCNHKVFFLEIFHIYVATVVN